MARRTAKPDPARILERMLQVAEPNLTYPALLQTLALESEKAWRVCSAAIG